MLRMQEAGLMVLPPAQKTTMVVAVADGAMVPERAVLRLFNADSLLIHSDTAPLRVAPLTTPTHATPSAQFLVPPATVNVTRWWEVVRDPVFGGSDASALNDRFPRRGSASLHLVSVPAIRIRLVPIRLSQHGGVTPAVAGAATEDFLWYLRTRFPFARIDVTIGAPLVSHAHFVDESGGEPGGTAFFTRVLHEVDLARSAHPDAADHYWVGVLPQPPGITVTRWAGLAYIPLQGASASIFARSQVIVGREWYGTAPQAAGRNLAHELGHNLGRWHAPCGDAVQYDHSFEPSDGRIGPWVHLVNEWADGVADSAAVNDPQAYGDIMSFCGPRAVGPYTYAGILRFRQLFGAALVAADEPRRVLVVRGTYGPNGVRVAPARTLVARASARSEAGGVWVDLLGADGRVLETVRAQVGAHGEAGTDRPFGVQLALTRSVEAALRSIRVRTPQGIARLESPAAVAGRALSTAPAKLP